MNFYILLKNIEKIVNDQMIQQYLNKFYFPHLNEAKIKYGIYFGEQTDDKRDKIVDNYNNGQIEVLLMNKLTREEVLAQEARRSDQNRIRRQYL